MEITPFYPVFPSESLLSDNPNYPEEVNSKYTLFAEKGLFKHLDQRVIVIHTITDKAASYMGLVVLTSIQDLKKGKIISHEETLNTKESKVISELQNRRAMLKPVMLMFESSDEIGRLCEYWRENQEPFFRYVDSSKIKHRYWKVDSPEALAAFQREFSKVNTAYIADGHHRTLALTELCQNQEKNGFQFLLSEYFSFKDLKVFPFHRALFPVKMSVPRLLESIKHQVEITKLKAPELPEYKHQILITSGEASYFIQWKKNLLTRYRSSFPDFDTVLLNRCILKPILSIQDIRTETTIHYIDGKSGLKGILQFLSAHPGSICFGLYPVLLNDIKKLTQSHQILPPKSTRFEPRIPNGIIIHKFE